MRFFKKCLESQLVIIEILIESPGTLGFTVSAQCLWHPLHQHCGPSVRHGAYGWDIPAENTHLQERTMPWWCACVYVQIKMASFLSQCMQRPYRVTQIKGCGKNKVVSHLEIRKHTGVNLIETKLKKHQALALTQKLLRCWRNMCKIWTLVFSDMRNLCSRVNSQEWMERLVRVPLDRLLGRNPYAL